jgi:hypothetical protein
MHHVRKADEVRTLWASYVRQVPVEVIQQGGEKSTMIGWPRPPKS